MSENRFKIVFDGALLPGVDIEHAKQKIAKLFKSDIAAIEPLFKGQNITLKRDLSQQDADIYLAALNQAGIAPRVEPDLAPGASQPTPQPAPPAPAPSLSVDLPQAGPTATSDWQRPTPTPAPEPMAGADTSPYTPPQATVGDPLPEFGELKFYTVDGRIGRLRYLAWTLVLILLTTLVGGFLTAALVGNGLQVTGMIFLGVVALAFAYLNITISVQRLHDLGWSGWLWLLNLLPFVYAVFPLLLAVLPGNTGANRYGAPPPPNSGAVKGLAALWIIVLLLSFIGGLSSV
ncbi:MULTISPECIES: DUF805 domain-containing protein [Pseudomonas]|uniref:DUF805 domain-containing protein n=1 Tax=Pseudomonas chlororaphis subsp. aureofaciens TaxID=587851 RepID=A0AAD1E8Y7_9PSED|nr:MULTISPECIES: DUF805 domain-containing protein [Pseudomonas]AIC23472.1 membrane protein [Pseudomonas chlororaphis]AZE26224.1 hypothetical protein C4K08_5841 [Pseudomonas chlororaphis subsp. aureofaciens]AZE32466.1 hypothetical protein C4K07_5725 [Pseudomonas chlororaphis subsp. aureofaciens]AZE38747.1 hypothetical protein C4K06_5758 [Pseudomonas chlororaphis subsp. aureofaciens]AZE45107.1 hypothetical protein C4K05_5811 [Pseudomonas chlororaphis subsp. aureofaciens]